MRRYAIFFPQYYPVAVNNLAWGYGFTDWSLVATANAFNYWQRRAPACGFYDLSIGEHIHARFEAAAGVGLDGFGIYHYYFDDGSELDAVESYLLRNNISAGMNYFYIWANENWTTRWVGGDIRLLKELSRDPQRSAIAAHVTYLVRLMESPHYTRVNKRPLFVFYHPDHFLNPSTVVDSYREEFQHAGINPLMGFFVKNFSEVRHSRYFDFLYLFEPRLFFNSHGLRRNARAVQMFQQVGRIIPPRITTAMAELVTRSLNRADSNYSFSDFLHYYSSSARQQLIHSSSCPVYEIVTCGWNNAPRYRQRATSLNVPTTQEFLAMMKIASSTSTTDELAPLMCNAWNEWCEGAALEPCSYLGDALIRGYVASAEEDDA
jgi:hypothetical protein